MDIIDSKYVDLKVVEGKIVVELPLVGILRELALKSDNKLDDKLVDLIEGALKKD